MSTKIIKGGRNYSNERHSLSARYKMKKINLILKTVAGVQFAPSILPNSVTGKLHPRVPASTLTHAKPLSAAHI